MGADALRYFLLREVVFGQDGSFSYDALVGRYNSDLANGLGNLASRTLTMIHQYRGGVDSRSPGRGDIAEAARRTTEDGAGSVRRFQFLARAGSHLGADFRGRQVHRRDGALEAGQGSGRASPETAGRDALHRRRSAAHRLRLVYPVLPESAREDLEPARHDGADRIRRARRSCIGDNLPAGQKDRRGRGVFPRIEAKRHRQDAGARRQGEGAAGGAARQAGRSACRAAGLAPRSPSTISPKSICASARYSRPSASKAPTSCCT